MIIPTIINLFIFICLIFVTIYLTGFLIIRKIYQDLGDIEIISLSLSLGTVMFTAFGILLGVAQLRFLFFPLLTILAVVTALKYKTIIFNSFNVFSKHKLLLLMIIAGILIQGFINFPSGYKYKDGLLFWSSQGFDGFWHISIMEEIKKEFPPQIPVFAGEKLVNYHYLSDVLMGEFGRIFPFFSSLDLYFRFFPVMFSFLMGINVFAFVKRWQNIKVAYWALFFTYFGGSFGYIVTFLQNRQMFGGETAFWVSQLNTVIANPPHAVAISLLVAFLLTFYLYLKQKKKVWLVYGFLCALFIAGFKVSSGVVLLGGLAAASIIQIFFYKDLSILGLLLLLGASNFITIKLMTKGVEGYLIFSPWWFIRTMVVDKLGLIDWELKRQHYISKGSWHAWVRVAQLEIYAFSIYLVGNIGTRVLGLLEVSNKIIISKYHIFSKPFEISILAMMLIAFVIPMVFLQKGIAYNTVQFMQYFLLIIGFYAAIAVANISGGIKNKLWRYAFMIVIISASIPTVIGNFVEFYGPGKTPLAIVSNEELEALDYLRQISSKEDIILSPTYDKYLKDKYAQQPFPIYAWYSTGYISGLTGRRTYLSLEEMVMQTGFDYKGRIASVNEFFYQDNVEKNTLFLQKENIKYIYIPKAQFNSSVMKTFDKLRLVFENSQVNIFKAD